MQTSSFPPRPGPYISLGNPFFGEGYIGPGFKLPTGTMVQPQFFLYGLLRSGVQTFNNGVDPATTQWVNSLQLFANFNATPTERFLIEFRPLDNTTKFSGYNWQPTSGPNSGWQNALNGRLYTLFFEGNFLSLFPGLDNGKSNLLGFDFSIGRQLLFLQSGVLINDNIDMVSITRPSLFSLGSSAATGSLIYAWGNIHRNGGFVSDSAQLIGGFRLPHFHAGARRFLQPRESGRGRGRILRRRVGNPAHRQIQRESHGGGFPGAKSPHAQPNHGE